MRHRRSENSVRNDKPGPPQETREGLFFPDDCKKRGRLFLRITLL